MKPGINMQRIFVVGMARSGTTLVQSILNAHSRVLSYPETHFLSKSIWLPKTMRWLPIRKSGIDNANDTLKRLGIKAKISNRIWISKKAWIKKVFSFLDRDAYSRGFEIWVEKTPLHLLYIDILSRSFPEARFVHVIRNPIHTINSLVKASRKHPVYFAQDSINKAIERYKRDLAISYKYINNRNHYWVNYESLILAPKKEIKKLCQFLRLEFEPAMKNFETSASKLIYPEERWKMNNVKSIRDTKTEIVLSDKEIENIILETSKTWQAWEDIFKNEASNS